MNYKNVIRKEDTPKHLAKLALKCSGLDIEAKYWFDKPTRLPGITHVLANT